VDRPAAALYLTSLAIGTTALVLLLLHRIDALRYGALACLSLGLLLAVVLRWRAEERAEALRAS
jgi:hypothetical protein